jgi:hypothetical protein
MAIRESKRTSIGRASTSRWSCRPGVRVLACSDACPAHARPQVWKTDDLNTGFDDALFKPGVDACFD